MFLFAVTSRIVELIKDAALTFPCLALPLSLFSSSYRQSPSFCTITRHYFVYATMLPFPTLQRYPPIYYNVKMVNKATQLSQQQNTTIPK